MEVPIPEDWLKAVVRILREGRFHRDILLTTTVQDRWDADNLGSAFIWDVRDPLVAALSQPGVVGLHVPNQPEPGVTYAFWFVFRSRQFYGKICLYNGKVKLKLLSAHLPNRGEDQL